MPLDDGGVGGRRLGSRYLLSTRIGVGGIGEVWQGEVLSTGQQVAVKLLLPQFADDPFFVSQFLQEGSILTHVQHPNLVRVEDIVAEGGTLAIVMELVRGPNLKSYLKRGSTLAPKAAVDIVLQVLDALGAVHEAGIVHRDVKPSNILLELSDTGVPSVRLADFGIAQLADAARSLSASQPVVGTPAYLAPEVITGGEVGPWTDLYAVGVVLYEMLAGRPPFVGRQGGAISVLEQHLEDEPDRIDVPDRLWRAIDALLAKDPARRPASARMSYELLATIEPSLAGLASLEPLPLRHDVLIEPTGAIWTGPNDLPTRVFHSQLIERVMLTERRRESSLNLLGPASVILAATVTGVSIAATAGSRLGSTSAVLLTAALSAMIGALVYGALLLADRMGLTRRTSRPERRGMDLLIEHCGSISRQLILVEPDARGLHAARARRPDLAGDEDLW